MRKLWENQLRNRFLWTPILIAMGAAVYFNMPFEPNLLFPSGLAIACFALAIFHRIPTLLRAAALFAFGFLYSCAYTNIIATPILHRNMHDAPITATVVDLDYMPDKSRIYMRIPYESANKDTALVRVSLPNDITPPRTGDTIRTRISLYRPDGMDAPESFDYARWAYFNGLTATGTMSEYEILATHTNISNIRDYIHTHANSFLTDSLVLGYKNTLDKDSRATWTAAGIAHVWSISGFHITLISGWLFAIFYLIFRSIPFITRRTPARIPATIFAWIGLSIYLFISGAGVATVRAFLMATLAFTAVLMGRSALSMRNVALALCAIFLMNPHYIMQAGFQLSFAAIFGLIWFWREYKYMPENKFMRILYTATMTALIATIFTMPFVAAHFHTIPVYGLIGNLILLPVFSIAIMPMTIIGTIVALTGFHGILHYADIIYNAALHIATFISSLPMSTIIAPHIPNIALMTITVGLASLMFIKPIKMRINYIIAGAFIITGITITAFTPKPVFYTTPDHELIAFNNDGKLEFNKSRASNHFFTFDTWRQMNGEDTAAPRTRIKAKDGVYEFATPKFKLVYIQKYVPLARNIVKLCNDDAPDYIVSYFKIDAPNCRAKILNGGLVIYKSGHVRHVYNNRPWHQ